MAFDKPPLATPAIPTLFKVPALFMCRSNSTQSPARIFVQTCLRPSAMGQPRESLPNHGSMIRLNYWPVA